MPGRRLISEEAAERRGYGGRQLARRRAVLRETLDAFERAPADHYHALARANLERWRRESSAPEPSGEVVVRPDDWGVATQALTKTYGRRFAALNMANAYSPGGAYVEGTAAQEENMFRRTDCHFEVGPGEMDPATDRYLPAMTARLSAADGRVHLDTDRPRVCVRGPEDRSRDDLGYAWLGDDEVFDFYELRAAALDCRHANFDAAEARRRIAAQLDTLRDAGVRYAVLSAFGCGAFQNPARVVAQLYREELDLRREDLALVAFAIYAPGYGPDNHAPFTAAFA